MRLYYLLKYLDRLRNQIFKIYHDKDYSKRFSLAVFASVICGLFVIIKMYLAYKLSHGLTISGFLGALVLALLIWDCIELKKKAEKNKNMTGREAEILRAMAIKNGLDPVTFKKIEKPAEADNKNDKEEQ